MTSSSSSGVRPTRTTAPKRKRATNPSCPTRNAKGAADRRSLRSSPVTSRRSPRSKALAVMRRLFMAMPADERVAGVMVFIEIGSNSIEARPFLANTFPLDRNKRIG
jgi:hypothetical protein